MNKFNFYTLAGLILVFTSFCIWFFLGPNHNKEISPDSQISDHQNLSTDSKSQAGYVVPDKSEIRAPQIRSEISKSLSKKVLNQRLEKGPNYVFSEKSVASLLKLLNYGYGTEEKKILAQYWPNGIPIDQQEKNEKKLKSDLENDVTIKEANQIWVDDQLSILSSYSKSLSMDLGLEPQTMNMTNVNQVVETINSWASMNTNQMIESIIGPSDIKKDTRIILANAIYFKAPWQNEFKKSMTKKMDFFKVGLVDTMIQKSAEIRFLSLDNGVILLELPFKGAEYSLVIAMAGHSLTKTRRSEWYDNVEENIKTFEYSKKGPAVKEIAEKYIIEELAFEELIQNGMYKTFDQFEFPKFELNTKIEDLKTVFSMLGFARLFQPGVLTMMTPNPDVKIDNIFQNAKIIVNEEGAEAAAITVASGSLGAAPKIETKLIEILKVNGPFAFAIRDNINSVTLFEGAITNPTKD